MFLKGGQQCLRFLCAMWLYSNVFVLADRSFSECPQGPVQPKQNCAVGQYPLHRCTQTAAEQLFLITEQNVVYIPTSANLLSACTHIPLSLPPLPVLSCPLSDACLNCRLSDASPPHPRKGKPTRWADALSPKRANIHLWLTPHYQTQCVIVWNPEPSGCTDSQHRLIKRIIKQLWGFTAVPPDQKKHIGRHWLCWLGDKPGGLIIAKNHWPIIPASYICFYGDSVQSQGSGYNESLFI